MQVDFMVRLVEIGMGIGIGIRIRIGFEMDEEVEEKEGRESVHSRIRHDMFFIPLSFAESALLPPCHSSIVVDLPVVFYATFRLFVSLMSIISRGRISLHLFPLFVCLPWMAIYL